MFLEADLDGDGSVSYDEFQNHLKDNRVKAYLRTLDLEAAEAEDLFGLLDLDGSGSVDIEELVMGCLKLKGQAKSIDVQLLMYENQHMMDQMKNTMDLCSRHFETSEQEEKLLLNKQL